MAGGRPSKYKKRYCKLLIEHFSIEPQTEKVRTEYYANGQVKSEEKTPWAQTLPTFQGFAMKIGVAMSTLGKWRNEHEEFSEAYARAREMQEHIWLQNSMSGLYNATFAKFFGMNCFGYKDRSEVDVGNAENKPFEVSIQVIE